MRIVTNMKDTEYSKCILIFCKGDHVPSVDDAEKVLQILTESDFLEEEDLDVLFADINGEFSPGNKTKRFVAEYIYYPEIGALKQDYTRSGRRHTDTVFM